MLETPSPHHNRRKLGLARSGVRSMRRAMGWFERTVRSALRQSLSEACPRHRATGNTLGVAEAGPAAHLPSGSKWAGPSPQALASESGHRSSSRELGAENFNRTTMPGWPASPTRRPRALAPAAVRAGELGSDAVQQGARPRPDPMYSRWFTL